MQNFEIVIIVFSILVALLAITDKLKLPNPVILVFAGLGIGFIPSLPSIVLNPEVVFLLFLPPILYDAASHTSWHDFKLEIVPISRLAIALVFLTTVAVAFVCYFFIPDFTWPLAFVVGAIVSPPDAAATTTITKGLGLNRRVLTILNGESLVNDASALIAYRFAIAALGSGVFVFWKAGISFLLMGAGGILTGVAIGYLLIIIHKRILNNSIISTSLTLLTPFISYLTAEHFLTSGVLAVVSTGLMISWRAPEIFSYQTRIRNRSIWDTVIFLLNGFIFILIGLQLPAVLADLHQYSLGELITYGLLVGGVTIAVRMLWVFGAAYNPISIQGIKKDKQDPESNTWKNVLIIAWTGTRGVISLATALALPLTLSDGSSFPQRPLILFLAFVVIFMTLVIQAFSLPLLLKILRVKPQLDHTDDENDLRLLMASSVLNFIEQDFPFALKEQVKSQIKMRYTGLVDLHSRKLEIDVEASENKSEPSTSTVNLEINKFQRLLLIGFHKEGLFNYTTIKRLEQELDHEELRLSSLKKKGVRLKKN
ncbi:MAG TPA: Na+/H+ antiporter [Cyclobacteriaceae bacterium]|nr:Na+/H+ antiporter [Cyclobacteriaceae bacterium]